ncbi:hypothetical protein [Nocardioides lijunqiniae]|uniref:hypothetical protein n=1 Tax=Nocardioides lijunqiniae TaxID=2760832 RepID=UPI00187840D4|nr:hypothetical protein [Nocardioides lijunqiniae]
MTSSSLTDARRQDRLRALSLLLAVGLAVAALVLGILVWNAAAGEPTVEADVGEKLPLRSQPYGREVTVKLPGSDVTVRVGDPVQTLGHELLDVEYDDPTWDEQQDLVAPEDGSLVTASWRVQALGGFAREPDSNPIEIRLLVDDQRVDLDSVVVGDTSDAISALDPTSVAVGVEGQPAADDLVVEVEYDGHTQTAHIGSGEVDAGVAQALYDASNDFSPGCAQVQDTCAMRAAPGSRYRPRRATFTATNVTLYPYDATLGWADEGSVWAGVRLQLFGADSVEDAAGGYWSVRRQSAPRVSLDGADPVRREGLEASTFDSHGRVVFQVDADTEPRELVVSQLVTPRGAGAPPPLTIRARLPLTPVG